MYFLAKVKVITETDSGKRKVNREQYLIEDSSITGAEARVAELFDGYTMDYEVTSISKSRISEVHLDSDDKSETKERKTIGFAIESDE